MEVPRSKIYLINALVTAGGIILLLIAGYLTVPILRVIFEALGTSAIVTAAINFLDRSLTERPEGAAVLAHTRNQLPKSLHEKKYKARHVDILGVSMTSCLREMVKERQADIARQILMTNDARMRILFVHPLSPYLEQREVEDNVDERGRLKANQLESVEYCVQLGQLLEEQLEHFKQMKQIYQPVGRLEVKLINACPYLTIERYDDDLHWGLYMSDTEGVNSPMLSASKKHNPDLHNKLKNHFMGMLKNEFPIPGAPTNMTLLTVTMNGVWINKELVNSLLPGRLDDKEDGK